MHAIATQGFVYPNEAHVAWSIMIALYPYITGLVAGAFIVSSLYHVFGDKDLKLVGNMALVAALCFIMFCMTPLLFHLGQPFRCFNIMFTPNLMSAMSIFGYMCFFYRGILLVEIWLVFRQDIIRRSQEGFVLKRWFYALLALGVTEASDEARALDKKIIGFFAAIGIPSACILHGYVGFIFGAIKSNPWWSTPLMPLIFLLSAIVSGISVLILMYMIAMKLTRRAISVTCIQSLCKYFWGFLIVDVTLEGLEVLTMGYEGEESWGILSQLMTGKLALSYIWIQGLIANRAEELPDFDVLTIEGAGVRPDEVRSYRQLWDNARRMAQVLLDRGVKPGERFALLMANHPEFVKAMIAASIVSAATVPIDPRTRGDKLHFMLANMLQRAARWAEAVDEYEAVVELQPAYFPALTRLAYLYFRQGLHARAVETWPRALPVCDDPALRRNIELFMRKLVADMSKGDGADR